MTDKTITLEPIDEKMNTHRRAAGPAELEFVSFAYCQSKHEGIVLEEFSDTCLCGSPLEALRSALDELDEYGRTAEFVVVINRNTDPDKNTYYIREGDHWFAAENLVRVDPVT